LDDDEPVRLATSLLPAAFHSSCCSSHSS
jgi:hypothetical protein